MSSGEPLIEMLDEAAADAARKPILAAIVVYNDQATGFSQPVRPLAITMRDPEGGEIAGGLYGISYYSWLFIELLVIPEQYRGRRFGTRLIGQAESAARERECVGVWLDTFSFQARGFYEKLGYRTFGEIAAYPPGHSRFYLSKALK